MKEDWRTLATYEDISRQINPQAWKEETDARSNGNPLIAQAQRYGG